MCSNNANRYVKQQEKTSDFFRYQRKRKLLLKVILKILYDPFKNYVISLTRVLRELYSKLYRNLAQGSSINYVLEYFSEKTFLDFEISLVWIASRFFLNCVQESFLCLVLESVRFMFRSSESDLNKNSAHKTVKYI